MKYVLGVILAIVIGIFGWFIVTRLMTTSNPDSTSQRSDGISTSTKAVDLGTYTIIPEESKITWTAQKPSIPGYVHTGTMGVQKGTLHVDMADITGEVVIDMNQIKIVSLGGGKAGNESRLETHLKSGDFFDVTKYPTATFVITQATKDDSMGTYTVTGALTMKENTHEITFPAQVFERDGKLHFTAQLEIDRTRWNITFGSANFFDSLAENAIGDSVGLSLNLIATPENN